MGHLNGNSGAGLGNLAYAGDAYSPVYPADSLFDFSANPSAYTALPNSTGTFSTSGYQQLVMTRNGGYGQQPTNFYVDGALVGTTTADADGSPFSWFMIGCRNYYSGYDWFQDMDVAIARVYSSALTGDQVAQNYQADAARFGLPTPEPSSIVLLASALVGLLAYAWRKRK